jgi:glucose-1-phosphatase
VKISSIFFDLGRVLVDFDFNLAAHRILGKTTLTEEALWETFGQLGPLMDGYESGRISTEDFFNTLRERLGFHGPAEELTSHWCDIFTPIEEHIRLARGLAEYYPLVMVSNTSEAHIQFLEPRHDFFHLFRHRVYSYQVGTMKPDPAIYQHALGLVGSDKFEALFIDDREENILTPAQMGWQTIHLRPDVSLLDALRSYELRGI